MSEQSTIDLYGILGVERTATKAEIHAAFREKAKIHHPDVKGGDKGRFGQIKLARDILTNLSWRANYDSYGIIDQESADNEIAAQLSTLTGIFGQVMHQLLSQGVQPHTGDFVASMHAAIKVGFDTVNKAMTALRHSRDSLEPMTGRFKVTNLELPNLMETIVEGQKAQIDQQIQQQGAQLRALETARIYLANVVFDRAPRPTGVIA